MEGDLYGLSRRYDSEEAKRIIRGKAFELFSLNGYNQTSVGDIAKASGYSKGHIYYHFENKEKLFVLFAQNSMHEWYTKWMENEPNYSSATEKWYMMAKHVLYNYQTPLLKQHRNWPPILIHHRNQSKSLKTGT